MVSGMFFGPKRNFGTKFPKKYFYESDILIFPLCIKVVGERAFLVQNYRPWADNYVNYIAKIMICEMLE